jgi:hypothetical protein
VVITKQEITMINAMSKIVAGIAAFAALATSASAAPIPANTRPVLLKDARRLAAELGDRHPHDIQAVRTTYEKAQRLEGHWINGEKLANETVYVVAMRGHFSCTGGCLEAPGTRDKAPPTPTIYPVAWMELYASTVTQYGGGDGQQYPDLKKAGTPVRLAG